MTDHTASPGQPTPPAPSPYAQPQQAPPPHPATPGNGLAIAALIVGIGAFVTGLVPFLGLLIAIVGIVLGIIAVRKPGGRGLSITGIGLSTLAALTNLVMIGLFIWWFPTLQNQPETIYDGAESGTDAPTQALELQLVDTPCFSFEGPAVYVYNTSADAIEACSTKLELWGEYNADGTVKNTGVGSILGTVSVEPIRSETVAGWATDGTLDAAVDYLDTNFIPQLGTVISLRESVKLDTSEANLTRVDSTVTETKTKAILFGYSPSEYATPNGDVNFFLVSFTTPEDNGDEIIAAVIDSWEWK
ncbi:MAG: DUF4190 domain-containing protein [Microbacteriaceae bacterium]